MTRLYIAAGLAIIAIAALFRWRAQGIRDAMARLELEDARRAQKVRDAANDARSNDTDSVGRVIKRLRAAGRLRADD